MTRDGFHDRYTGAFYSNQIEGAKTSASRVLEILFELTQPKSVIDVGCGRGAWLSAAIERGAEDALGLDGEWVSELGLIDSRARFQAVDLESAITLNRTFDLCISCEVAEHLPPGRASSFVKDLTHLSDLIIFSAAIKGQGGTHHINEMPQSFWIEKFGIEGFECFDMFRPAIWQDAGVEVWYKQNIFLFARGRAAEMMKAKAGTCAPSLVDVVHPDLFNGRLRSFEAIIAGKNERLNRPSFREIVRINVVFVLNAIGWQSK